MLAVKTYFTSDKYRNISREVNGSLLDILSKLKYGDTNSGYNKGFNISKGITRDLWEIMEYNI